MQPSRPADEDRLPWLEPYREGNRAAAKPLPQRRGRGGPLAIGSAIGLLMAVGAGGYWLGQREDVPVTRPSASQTVALPAPKPAPVAVAEAPPPPPVTAQPAPPPQREIEKPRPAKTVAKRRKPVRKKIRNAGVERSRINAVRAAQERRAPRRPWPKMPSPGPAGQVVQLGAFSTPARANAAYYQRIARYKSLARMPRVVVPVVSRPDGRVLYVLRLGTSSRQQSKTVCRNLRASGDHCLVIG